jgi:glycosidase
VACQSGDLRISFRTVKVGIFVNPHKAGSLDTLHALRSALHFRGCTVVLDLETAELAEESGGVAAAKFSDLVDIVQ